VDEAPNSQADVAGMTPPGTFDLDRNERHLKAV
jgi:hypothetical protein